MKTILITGATAGFGEACAHTFARHHHRLILTGRRAGKLEALKTDLFEKYGAEVWLLPFDVQNSAAVTAAIGSLPANWQAIDVLINNAGLALGRDVFNEGSLTDWETMIDTNIKGLLYVSKAVVPLMVARRQGHIINLGSVASKDIYEKGNVYCATKAAVEALSKGMRIDLLPHHIKVTAIHPGAADTEFSVVRFKGAAQTAAAVYEGYEPLHATDVADVIYYCATLPPHVCINDLVLTCTQQANAIYTVKDGKL